MVELFFDFAWEDPTESGELPHVGLGPLALLRRLGRRRSGHVFQASAAIKSEELHARIRHICSELYLTEMLYFIAVYSSSR